MPRLKIRSGIELYYELHGEGYPLVLSASTGCGQFEGHRFSGGIPIGQCLEFVAVGGDVAERERQSHRGEFWYTPRFRQEHADVVERIVQLAATDAPPLKSYLRHIAARQN